MRKVFRVLKVCFSKWWVKWPVILFAVPILLAVMYLLTFNWVTEREDKKFVEKWEPLIGSLKHEDVFPAIPENEDLAKDPMFLKLVDSDYRESWNVMGFIGEEDEMGEYGYTKAMFTDTDCDGVNEFSLRTWSGKRGISDSQIAEEALERLAKVDGDIDDLERLLDKYTRISCKMNGLVRGEVPFGGDEQTINLIKLSRVFSERAILRAYVGDGQAVIGDLRSMRKLQTILSETPTLVGLLVEVAVSAEELRTLEQCLRQGCFGREQLQELLVMFKPRNATHKLAATAKGEYLWAKALSVAMAEGEVEFPTLDFLGVELGGSGGLELLPDSMALSGNLVSTNFFLEQMYYPGGKLVERFSMDQYRDVELAAEGVGSGFALRERFAVGLVDMIPRQMPRVMDWQARMEMAQLAIACEVYKYDSEGWYPLSLTQLVPKYLKVLPADPFMPSDQYKYKKKAKGVPVMYSVGVNELDDGGANELSSSGSGEMLDILWGKKLPVSR